MGVNTKLTTLRKRLELSQEEFAIRAGVSRGTVIAAELGSRPLSPKSKALIAAAVDVPVNHLFEEV